VDAAQLSGEPAALTVDVERRFPRGPTIAGAFALDLAGARTLVLFGASGSGKSTILRCLAGLERPDRGRIAVGADAWFDADRGIDLAPQRRSVGYLPQGFALFPHLDVRANIAYGMPAGDRAGGAARVGELVRLLRLEGLERRRPGELSGGQQQRVALARALARRPRLLLLDEPLGALDAPTREALRGELRGLLVASGVPAIVVTHDRAEALALGDEVAIMAAGVVRQVGPIVDVFDHPADETVARIVGVETVVAARVVDVAAGLLALAVGTVELHAIGEQPVGASVLASIRAEDVTLVAGGWDGVGAVSARNRFPAVVTGIEPAGPLVRVHLDCGFPLVAAITRPALAELELAPGSRVTAVVKAPAVHVIG
jgi:molybdate transport system ATP-binding protein